MDIVVRASAIYIVLWLVLRGMGKRELAQLSPFDFVLLVIMGDLIQQGVTQDDRSIFGALIAVATITLWVVTMSWITFRWRRANDVVNGLPVVVVRDGKTDEDLLRYQRLTADELLGEARGAGIDDISKVAVAVLEPEGTFSFVLRDSDVVVQRLRRAKKNDVS